MKLHYSIFALTTAVLTACVPLQSPPNLSTRWQIPAEFASAPDSPVHDDIRLWWQQFNDPALNILIVKALQAAPDLAIAQARLNQALATERLANADTTPVLGVSAVSAIGANNLDNPQPALLPAIGQTISQGAKISQGALSARWSPDFFGKKQSDADAASFARLGEEERLHGARLLLAATLAQNYFEIRAKEAEQRIIHDSLNALNSLIRYAKGRYRAAQATQYDIDELNAKAAALRAKAALLKAQRNNSVAKIAALIGTIPQGFKLEEDGGKVFHHLPLPPSGQYPQNIITRRPDIRARKAAVMAYAAKRASAQADFYPRFSLNFALADGHLNLGGDLSGSIGANGTFLGLNMQLPLFTGGRLQANLDKADAQLQQSLAEYDKTLLDALAETDNSYRLAVALRKQEQSLMQAKTIANQQISDAKKLFHYGKITFDKIITARIAANDYAEKYLANQHGQALNLIHLYTALGGGW